MALITAITQHPRRSGRFELRIEGEPKLVVSDEALAAHGLRVGQTLNVAALDALRRAAAEVHALDRALNMLAFRGRSSAELRRNLLRKGEPAQAVDLVIPRLVAAGLLNDAQYARQLARSKLLDKGFSRHRLRAELFRRGVERRTAEVAIDEVLREEDFDEDTALERLARQQLPRLRAVDPDTRRRRLYGYLARRGYASSAIRRVVRRLADESRESASGA